MVPDTMTFQGDLTDTFGVPVKEQPTRLRFQQVSEGDALTSPAVSIVWFGHVVMPELATGNGASTARCIRPGGRRDIVP
jgi:hypothetical protein